MNDKSEHAERRNQDKAKWINKVKKVYEAQGDSNCESYKDFAKTKQGRAYKNSSTTRHNHFDDNDEFVKGACKKDRRSNKLSKEEQEDLDNYLYTKDNPERYCSECQFYGTRDCQFDDETDDTTMPEDFDCNKYFD